MEDDGERLRWGVRRRLEFIDFRLFWDGRFNRSDLAHTFGISAAAGVSRHRAVREDRAEEPSL